MKGTKPRLVFAALAGCGWGKMGAVLYNPNHQFYKRSVEVLAMLTFLHVRIGQRRMLVFHRRWLNSCWTGKVRVRFGLLRGVVLRSSFCNQWLSSIQASKSIARGRGVILKFQKVRTKDENWP